MRALGFDRALWNDRRINHAHIADLAFLDQAQLLRAGQQVEVQLAVDLDVARQAQQVLFGVGERLDLAAQAIDFLADSSNLCVQRLDDRVGGGELRTLLAALLLQHQQVALELDGRLKVTFSLGAQVKGAVLVAKLVETQFGIFKLLFKLWQEVAQKFKRFFSFGGLALDVLSHIVGAHGIQRAGNFFRVVALQLQGNHTRLFALLRNGQIALQSFNHIQARITHHVEMRAGLGLEFGHQDAALVFARAKAGRRACLALYQRLAVGVTQFKAAFRGHQQQRLALQCIGHFQQAQANGFLARNIALHAHETRVRQPGGAARHPVAHQGKVFGSSRHIELQVIYRLGNDQARTQDFNLGRGG